MCQLQVKYRVLYDNRRNKIVNSRSSNRQEISGKNKKRYSIINQKGELNFMKILAMYLPQYHEIEENNKWWGKGYTEWNAVKNAKPLYPGHKQPRIPMQENYYDLSDESAVTWKWQAELANKYGVYGFCIYHYWFGKKQLLEKPMQILLQHPEINIHYCICWANETWTRVWYDLKNELLIKQEYGDKKEWKRHFYYLLPFFRDERYIKIDNKPMINIYHSAEIERFEEMKIFWNELAKAEGFAGVFLVSGNTSWLLDKRNIADAYYEFEPGFTLKHGLRKKEKAAYLLKTLLRTEFNKIFKMQKVERMIDARIIYKNIEKQKTTDAIHFPGTFPMWDNTPRRNYKGLVYCHTSPKLFEQHLQKLKKRILQKPFDFFYINAWNEWGEGAYLEPDTTTKFKYLQIIKKFSEEEF